MDDKEWAARAHRYMYLKSISVPQEQQVHGASQGRKTRTQETEIVRQR